MVDVEQPVGVSPENESDDSAGRKLKPSDGLEPSTPSLPSSDEAGTEGKRGKARARKPRKTKESSEEA